MGEEKPEISEGKLSSQSGYSPVKQVDPNEIIEDVPKLSLVKSKENIPNGKKGKQIADSRLSSNKIIILTTLLHSCQKATFIPVIS